MKLSHRQRLTLAWIGLALVGLALIWLLKPVLAPFIAAAVLAYALQPLVERLTRRRVPRVLAVALVEVGAVLVLLAIALLIVPILSKELPLLREQIPVLAQQANTHLAPWLKQFGIQVSLDVPSIKAFVLKYLDANLEDWLGTALSSARIGGSLLLTLVGNLVLLPVVVFYVLNDWPQLVERAWSLVPPRFREPVGGFLSECDQMLGQYLRGQLMVMAALAVFYSVGLALAGFDLALPIGVFTGLAVFIPYLGFGLGLLLALLAGVLQFASLYGVLAVAVVFGLGQLVEGFFLTPRLVGERIGLSPLMVIFALLAFGHLFGFVGVLIALPLSALGVVAWRRTRNAYLDSPLYQG
ncbi:AI-2E family transporter [Pelomonas sp. SE-A7]|uniref:AI-2E family transporter n=1 Tax=Pelomonas sp. SE-A7 TaxID=3054953 RepID=UPI00259D0F39|nr:AI-2E family transporter [Pelomonas sp. SE-A7]MDM4764684.1 AI-2E family transporter [Pelomonas sp. SE-A7]